jgi:hypothetical protein
MKPQKISALLLFVLIAHFAIARENEIVTMWPSTGPAVLKVSFGRFRESSSYNGMHDYTQDVTVENVSPKNIPFASFTVYVLDKNKVRVADSILQIKDLAPGQQVREPLQFHASGVPSSVDLVARNDANGIPTSLRSIPLKIISVPAGAKLKIDGQDVGTTPYSATLRAGSHVLDFSKEGYAPGRTPLEVAPDELPGGSITFELGGLSQDTVELRDGTVLLCDVVSLSMAQITVRLAGQDQTYDRNRVRKIMLVEREIERPAIAQPGAKQ